MQQLVKIDNAMVQKLLADSAMRREFPFLAAEFLKQKKKAKKGSCCGQKKRSNLADHTAVKKAIASQPAGKLRKLKQRLKAKQVEITYNNGSGKMVKLRF